MNHYAKAIKIIARKEYNTEEVILKLAQEHPALFVKLASKVKQKIQKYGSVVQYMREDKIVDAIKELREIECLGLFEAKHIMCHIQRADPLPYGFKYEEIINTLREEFNDE